MSTRLAELADKIRNLEQEIEQELKEELQRKAEQFRYHIDRGRIRFQREARPIHLRLRKGVGRFLLDSNLVTIVAAPVIYAMLVPLALLDLATSIYQSICFRAYGIARVKRGQYVILDRRRLDYLNWIEKMNCEYCSYANGVIAYVREVGARTEQYWCPIKHARRMSGAHARYREFLDYGDAEAYRRELAALRRALRTIDG